MKIKLILLLSFNLFITTISNAEEKCIINYSKFAPKPTTEILKVLNEKGYELQIDKDSTFIKYREEGMFWIEEKKSLSEKELPIYEGKFFILAPSLKPSCQVETKSSWGIGEKNSKSLYQCSFGITYFNTYQGGKLIKLLPMSTAFNNNEKFSSEALAFENLYKQFSEKLSSCSKIKVANFLEMPKKDELNPAKDLKNELPSQVNNQSLPKLPSINPSEKFEDVSSAVSK